MNKKDLRIAFMGTPTFARSSLQEIVENGFNVVGVFAQPDRQSGRGMKMKAPPVKEYALEKGIPIYQPEKIKEKGEILPEVMDVIKSLNPSVIIVVAYGKILPKELLDYPNFGCINIHGSILPQYRGAAPIQWSLINGDTKTGVTIMYMDEGMDTGDIIEIEETPIESIDTYETIHDKLMNIGKHRIVKVLHKIISLEKKVTGTKQPENFTVAPMIDNENSKIDFNKNSTDIYNLIRGLNPVPLAWCKIDEDRVYKIYSAEVIGESHPKYADIKNDDNINNYNEGQVVYLSDKQNLFVVKCRDGYINILSLKPKNKGKMTCSEYIRGNKIKLKDKFN